MRKSLLAVHRLFSPPELLETNTSYKLARSPISQCSLFPPDGKMVALLCLLSCFYFVSICFCVFMCIYVILVFSLSSMFMTRYLGHYICHLMNKTGSSMTLWGNVPFNLSGYCCFEFRDSLKSLLKKIIVLLPCYYIWCFSKTYLDYLQTGLPLYFVNVLLFKKRQIYIYVKKKHVDIFKSKKRHWFGRLFYIFSIYIYKWWHILFIHFVFMFC